MRKIFVNSVKQVPTCGFFGHRFTHFWPIGNSSSLSCSAETPPTCQAGFMTNKPFIKKFLIDVHVKMVIKRMRPAQFALETVRMTWPTHCSIIEGYCRRDYAVTGGMCILCHASIARILPCWDGWMLIAWKSMGKIFKRCKFVMKATWKVREFLLSTASCLDWRSGKNWQISSRKSTSAVPFEGL